MHLVDPRLPDRDALRQFLLDARARLSPADVGLAPTGRRRVVGLRREEVAELADMSSVWYTRFESGRARLSIKALRRIADALRFDERETHRFIRLAATRAGSPEDHMDGEACRELRELHRLHHAIDTTRSLYDVRTEVLAAVIAIAHQPTFAYWIEEDQPECGVRYVAVVGPEAPLFANRYEGPEVMAHVDRRALLGGPVSENLLESPSAAHRVLGAATGGKSYRIVPVQPEGEERSMRIGYSSAQYGDFPAPQRLMLDIIGKCASARLCDLTGAEVAVR